MNYQATRQKVYNRGRPPVAFLDELVAWGRTAPDEIFAPNAAADIYSSVKNTLGPWRGPEHRRAVMLEVLRVLGGYESSWDWNAGIDTANPDSDTPEEFEAGLFQVSANSMNYGPEFRDLVRQRAGGRDDPDTFQRVMKADHTLALEYAARVLRRTIRHHGPVLHGHIHPWLRRDAVEEFLGLATGLAPGEADRPSREALETARHATDGGAGELWIPHALRNEGGRMKTRGRYRHGHPEGAIVHFTAGGDDPSADIENALANGYAYLVIAPDGTLYQNHPLDEWGYHAGVSHWPALGSGVSQYLVGIEICASGKLRDLGTGAYRPWYNEEDYLKKLGRVPNPARDLGAEKVRHVSAEANRVAGWYEKYTNAQENTLRTTLLWLRDNKPGVFSIDLVLGHDEVSPGRKNDPGGALSVTMPSLRASLQSAHS
jgi:hypothetical protein